MSNKLMIFESNRKKGGFMLFGVKMSCLKRIRGYDIGKERDGSTHVTAEKILSYLQCLSSKFEV